MLDVYVEGRETYNEDTNEFGMIAGETLHLEFSLIALSKWESKYKVPFLSKKEFTPNEMLYMVECMCVKPPKDRQIIQCISAPTMSLIREYINDPYSATTIKQEDQSPNREIITSELIYYWLVAGEIPFEVEKWHLNRLFKLVEIVSIKNQPAKKMSQKDIAHQNASLNAARRKALNSKG